MDAEPNINDFPVEVLQRTSDLSKYIEDANEAWTGLERLIGNVDWNAVSEETTAYIINTKGIIDKDNAKKAARALFILAKGLWNTDDMSSFHGGITKYLANAYLIRAFDFGYTEKVLRYLADRLYEYGDIYFYEYSEEEVKIAIRNLILSVDPDFKFEAEVNTPSQSVES